MASSSSPYIVFVDPLVEVSNDMWLDYLLLYGERKDVAFVAPHLYRHDGNVVAAGLLIGKDGLMPAMRRFRRGEDGFAGSLACDREVSALPAAMILVDRRILDSIGGFDLEFSTPLYMFADAAVRAMKAGYRNIAVASPLVCVDHAYQLEEPGAAVDSFLFRDIHAGTLEDGDPFYSVNFRGGGEDYLT